MATITTGKFLRREDVSEAGTTVKVVRVWQEKLRLPDGGSETKWLVEFAHGSDTLKPLVLNSTNIRRCVATFGTQETDDWVGKAIVVYDDPTIEFGGKLVGGLRLRAVAKKAVPPDPVEDEDEPTPARKKRGASASADKVPF